MLGTTVWTMTIANLLAGTPGAWWDAECDFACTALAGTSATVALSATVTFQAAGGVTAAQAFDRGAGNSVKTVTVDANGLCAFDLRRVFTNANNTMQIDTLQINRVN